MTGLHVTVTQGLRGWFAVLVDDRGPVQSGIGSYATAQQAEREAADWARSEGLPFRGVTQQERQG
jgi:hypothetical protein